MNANCIKATSIFQYHRLIIHLFSKQSVRSCFCVQSTVLDTLEIWNSSSVNNYNHRQHLLHTYQMKSTVNCSRNIHLVLTTTLWGKYTIIIIPSYKGKNWFSERLSKWKQVGDMMFTYRVGKVQEPSGMSWISQGNEFAVLKFCLKSPWVLNGYSWGIRTYLATFKQPEF